MDEGKSNLTKGENLPLTDWVYRIVLSTWRDRKNKSIPSMRCFDLSSQDDNKLSVDWSAKTTAEESIARVGASYKFDKEEYKPFENREVYGLSVKFLNNLKDIEKTIYDPLIYSPPEKGRPDNLSHSLIVFYSEFLNDKARRPETLLKIRNHAKDNKVVLDTSEVERLVELLRRK